MGSKCARIRSGEWVGFGASRRGREWQVGMCSSGHRDDEPGGSLVATGFTTALLHLFWSRARTRHGLDITSSPALQAPGSSSPRRPDELPRASSYPIARASNFSPTSV
ncbi:hypothetical protein EJ06DRAFT_295718 [Trichodelitschia bisporula]|uniref:Uncharacterized protein n=1 Tax=Trichodelitschia bisporula TaxID=703511 RepID=A0A6G1I6B2_9PEZI|nr:hypothetical protein EJ06DRAFT_295718 [Trichodelitschia bisporula]